MKLSYVIKSLSTVSSLVIVLITAIYFSEQTVLAEPTPQQEQKPLQFTSNNHILNFSNTGVMIVAPTHMLKVDFSGANTTTPISSVDLPQQQGTTTQQLPSFTPVRYNNVWNGIDVVYEPSNTSIMKSTYYVDITKPNVTPDSIRLTYNRPVSLDAKGNLVITYDMGSITESAPIAWQVIDGVNVPVDVSFNISDTQEVGFTLGSYNPNYPLVIDPEYTWNAFLGGAENSLAMIRSIAFDSDSNVYVGGSSDGTWGTPVRAYTADNGVENGFVAKINSSGTLVWNTFLGAAGNEREYSITLDSDNNIYVGGSSAATWGTPVQAYTAGNDGFVAKLNSSGTLVWNTFVGGAGTDFIHSIALDLDSNVFVGGYSDGTWGTPLRAYIGSFDAFLAKLTSAGSLINLYSVTPTAGANGSISPSIETNVEEGDDITFTITPDASYTIEDVLVDGVSVGPVASHTFTNVEEVHTIEATFDVLAINLPVTVVTTDTTATITFTTNLPFDSVVQYGATDSYGIDAVSGTNTTNHTVTLTGLTPETTYHYQAIATDQFDTSVWTDDDTFTTTATPVAATPRRSGGGGRTRITPPVITPAPTTSVQTPAIPATPQPVTPITSVTPSTTFTRNLTTGSRGVDVTALQNILIQKGHLAPGFATGYFGDLTKAALAQYQAANDISPALGFFGPLTRSSLGGQTTPTTPTAPVAPTTPTTPATPATPAASSSTFTRNLTTGSRGVDVTALQNILIQKGHLAPGFATGYFGDLTKAALAQYQAANNISPAVGFFGPVTRVRVVGER